MSTAEYVDKQNVDLEAEIAAKHVTSRQDFLEIMFPSIRSLKITNYKPIYKQYLGIGTIISFSYGLGNYPTDYKLTGKIQRILTCKSGIAYECFTDSGTYLTTEDRINKIYLSEVYIIEDVKEKKVAYQPTGRKRGRPCKPEGEKKTPYISTGKPRGRPKLDSSLKKTKVYVKSGGKRGRPAKKTIESV